MAPKITTTHAGTVHTLVVESQETQEGYEDKMERAQKILDFLSGVLNKEEFSIFLEISRERRVATYRGTRRAA